MTYFTLKVKHTPNTMLRNTSYTDELMNTYTCMPTGKTVQ